MTIIDKTDLTALRKADSVCFDHNVPTDRDGTARGSFIRAIKRAGYDNPDPFATDVTHHIAIDSHAFSYGGGIPSDAFVAFEMIHSAQYTETWRTIVSLLRAGDDVSLKWAADNGNGYLKDAGLYRDALQLIVQRGDKRLTFHVDTSVCQDNTARMIRRLSYTLTD